MNIQETPEIFKRGGMSAKVPTFEKGLGRKMVTAQST